MNYETMSDREIDALTWDCIAGPRRAEKNRNAPVVWEPTADIGQAFEVVEAMWGRWRAPRITKNLEWRVIFTDVETQDAKSAEHESLPRAICIAALRAVEAE